jgi:hypothetical protein
VADALIPLCAVVFGALAALAVALLEYRGTPGEQRATFRRLVHQVARHPWKPLLAGISTALLAAGSAAEVTTKNFGPYLQNHPVFTEAMTGAALLGITVLVIEVLLQRLAAQHWQPSLENAWIAVVDEGRRGAADIAEHLGHEMSRRVTLEGIPSPDSRDAKKAYRATDRLQIELGHRVGRASHAAWAASHAELDDSLHKLFRAADTLRRALDRYCAGKHSVTAGRPRTRDDIEGKWRDYVCWLLELDRQGRDLGFATPIPETYGWLDAERESPVPAPA